MKPTDNEYTFHDLLKLVFKNCDMTEQVDEINIIATYKDVVGDLITKLTQDIKVKNKTLYLKVSSAALRNELSYKKQDLINKINANLKTEAIHTIIFV
ncbi:MAG: DUF721 domain-containing protein [Bacteroidales bacterium]|nr:DUF721 domain-containing protein [Bacteroidales bacterium]MBR5777701.1 DUF721 domain-containing protein [Bacteroidales bacterium]